MATRQEVQRRRESLVESIKRSAQSGSLPPGALLPTVRELSEEHGLSTTVVFQVIQQLIDEGLLYTVPRVGTFVGRPNSGPAAPFLMLVDQHDTASHGFWRLARTGFEERISQLGGHSLVLTYSEAKSHRARRDLPPVAGVFHAGHRGSASWKSTSIPEVSFGILGESGTGDRIHFDDVAGGMQAARHLLQAGHRRIAFLGLHHPLDNGFFHWSAQRADGWRIALSQSGLSTENLEFGPRQARETWEVSEHRAAALEAAADLLSQGDFTAVVTSNEGTLCALSDTLMESGVPQEEWPAIVSFDESARTSAVSHMRLPWEEIGREAAQVLFERASGRLTSGPQQRLVPMRLIARLSCRPAPARAAWVQQPNSVLTASVTPSRVLAEKAGV
jgi:DNA-binding LacI/PurR family transcriptional regulator